MIDVFHDDDDDSSVEGHVLDELKGHHLQGGDLNLSLRTVVFRKLSSYETKIGLSSDCLQNPISLIAHYNFQLLCSL